MGCAGCAAVDEASCEGIGDHRHADCAHDRPRRCDPEVREDFLAHCDELPDLDHRFRLTWPIALAPVSAVYSTLTA